jgi:hypothetical protein
MLHDYFVAHLAMSEIVELNQSAGQADAGAVDCMHRLRYTDLRKVVHGKLRRRPESTALDTTALAHGSAA